MHGQVISVISHNYSLYNNYYFLDKEEELKHIVTELPDQPITKAVLDGYSRARMVTSFSNTIVVPGAILKRDNHPIIVSNGDQDEEEPAILPVDSDVSMGTEYEFSHNSQALLLNEVIIEYNLLI